MSDENPFEAMMKAGQDWAKSINPALEKFTAGDFEGMFPTMSKDMMEQFMGKGLNPEGLDAKTKLLLTLQGLTIQGAIAEAQIKLTVRHAVAAGATGQEVADTITLAGMFGGIPAMTKAMELATAVMKKDDET
ncbi:MAG: carboxymuconolactone decarboxylase family protein [Octadecabacter sp.]|jgi:4-carboxymuconolactone decarboxylase